MVKSDASVGPANAGSGGVERSRATAWSRRAGIRLDLDTAARAFPLGRLVLPARGARWSPSRSAGCGPGITTLYRRVARRHRRAPGADRDVRPHDRRAARSSRTARPTSRALPPGLRRHHSARRSRATPSSAASSPRARSGSLVVVVPSSRPARGVDRRGPAWQCSVPEPGRRGRRRGGRRRRVGTYLWANIMPYLIRPAYKYSPPPVDAPAAAAPGAAGDRDRRAPHHASLTLLLRRRACRSRRGRGRSSASRHLGGRRACSSAPSRTRVLVLLVSRASSPAPLDVIVLAAGFVVGRDRRLGGGPAPRSCPPDPSRRMPGVAHRPAPGSCSPSPWSWPSAGSPATLWPRGLPDSIVLPDRPRRRRRLPGHADRRFSLAAHGRAAPAPDATRRRHRRRDGRRWSRSSR